MDLKTYGRTTPEHSFGREGDLVMKKLVAASACIALFSVGFAMGAQERRNATAWNAHSSIERLMYANGYFDGLLRGSLDGAILAGSAAQTDKPPMDSGKLKSSIETELRELGTGKNGHIDMLKIEKRMTAFYDRFP
jgi:hypothetical protein